MSPLVLVSLLPPKVIPQAQRLHVSLSPTDTHILGSPCHLCWQSIWPVKFRKHIFPSEESQGIWYELGSQHFLPFLLAEPASSTLLEYKFPDGRQEVRKFDLVSDLHYHRPCVHLQVCLLPCLSQTSCFHFPRLPPFILGCPTALPLLLRSSQPQGFSWAPPSPFLYFRQESLTY